jgi:hypothetical protein
VHSPKAGTRALALLILVLAGCSTTSHSTAIPDPADRKTITDVVALRQATVCNCYYRSDCPRPELAGWACRYWPWTPWAQCTASGKFDGVCAYTPPWYNPTDRIVSHEAVSEAVDLWFRAYIAGAPKGGDGLPDEELVSKALAIPLPKDVHLGIKAVVFNTLDVLAGFDFRTPPGNCYAQDPRCLGFFRIQLDPEGVRLLESGRRGLVESIRRGDKGIMERELQDFWKTSDYHPHHTGRCYPHGHPEFATAGGSPLTCQQLELGGILDLVFTAFTTKRTPSGHR